MTTAIIEQEPAVSFEDRLVGILNDGALALMVSIGHRTGLFDTLARSGAVTVDELAAEAELNSRYVREWLGAMTVGRIVDHDPASGTYLLPAEHARFVSRRSPQENLAVFAQYIPLLGAVEDDIVESFRNGGGVPYEAFPRFHEVMEEDSAQGVLSGLGDDILPLVPGLAQRLEAGIRVIDVGCGRGRALNQLAAWYPNSTFTGYDLSEEAIDYARATAEAMGNTNVTFEVMDAARLGEAVPDGSVDLVTTFDAVHDQADPTTVVAAIRRALAPDGVYLAVDIDATGTHHGDLDHPLGAFLYTVSTMHCMTVSLAQGGDGFGAMWGRPKALEVFQGAGFGDVTIHTLDHDPQNAYYVCRP